MIPYDKRPPMNPSGIRVGTPAATTRGMKESEMKIIAEVFKEAIINKDNENKLKELKTQILELCQSFPIYK
jgi:glycine hydroxymethyltransferase